jgi:pimeloyl-ACP methyl ester carboxylesterase
MWFDRPDTNRSSLGHPRSLEAILAPRTNGYDAGTLADDLAALMTKLGHHRFAVVGHDTGYIIGYALAADHRDRVDRLAVAEIPGPPGVGDDPSLWLPEPVNNKVWHIPFNRVNDDLIVDMVHSNADGFYDYEFAIQAGGATLPDYAIDYYVKLYNRNKDVLRATFGLYRAWDAHVAQNRERAKTPLTIPVVAIGGENSWGALAGEGLKPAANDVQTVIIRGVGHWVAETAPKQMLKTLDSFLAPYRAASNARQASARPRRTAGHAEARRVTGWFSTHAWPAEPSGPDPRADAGDSRPSSPARIPTRSRSDWESSSFFDRDAANEPSVDENNILHC